MKRILFVSALIFLSLPPCFSQANLKDTATAVLGSTGNFNPDQNQFADGQTFAVADGKVALAQSMIDYPVTPGDVYTLSFVTGAGPITQNLIVDAECGISLGNIGKIAARGFAFPDLQRLVEKKVLEAYPLSSPILVIQSVGTIQVFLKGEVKTAGNQFLWGYSRLSELWGKVNTSYASCRSVSVRSRDGKTAAYDLYRYWRFGDMSQNPLLKPDDAVEFAKAERIVSISGQVRRPGSYQLLSIENLHDLIMVYADGFTAKAFTSKIHLTRFTGDRDSLGEKQKIDFIAHPDFSLEDQDAVNVIPMQDFLPVVYFEGALGVGVDGQDPQAATKVVYTFYPGEKLSQAVQVLRAKFSAVSDLGAAYLLRDGANVPIDLSAFIYNKDYKNDVDLRANDTIIVPFRQFFVSVAGAVKAPGRFPYIPDRNWEYYVNLAGGVDEERSSGTVIKILDMYGKGQEKDRIIHPEDSISIKADSFVYGFSRIAGIVSAIISTASLVISLIMAFR